MRSGASVSQLLALSSDPRGARISRVLWRGSVMGFAFRSEAGKDTFGDGGIPRAVGNEHGRGGEGVRPVAVLLQRRHRRGDCAAQPQKVGAGRAKGEGGKE